MLAYSLTHSSQASLRQEESSTSTKDSQSNELHPIVFSLFKRTSDEANFSALKIFHGSRSVIKKTPEITTDCGASVLSLMILFSGHEKAKRIYSKLLLGFDTKIPLVNAKDDIYLTIKDLFFGSTIQKLDKSQFLTLDKWQFKELCYKQLDSVSQPFKKQLHQLWEADGNFETQEQKLEQTVQKLRYDFNQAFFEGLYQESLEGVKTLTPNYSNIFYVTSLVPTEDNKRETFHCFVIEQSLDSVSNQAVYRLYQSWVSQSTLAEDMEKRGYSKKNNLGLDQKKFESFFRDLRNSFCLSSLSEEKRKRLQSKVFGYQDPLSFHLTWYRSSSTALNGISFRYFMDRIDKREVVHNIEEWSRLDPTFHSLNPVQAATGEYLIPTPDVTRRLKNIFSQAMERLHLSHSA